MLVAICTTYIVVLRQPPTMGMNAVKKAPLTDASLVKLYDGARCAGEGRRRTPTTTRRSSSATQARTFAPMTLTTPYDLRSK